MQFNETTNHTGLIQQVEHYTGLGLGQISNNATRLKEFTRIMNARYHQIVTMIFEALDEWDFDDPNHDDTGFIKTYNLVADTQTVKLPMTDKILKIKRAEITFDGTNWKKLEPIDLNEYTDVSDQATIAKNFDTDKPYYDLHGNYVYIYPIPTANVTNGLKLWVAREIDEFTDSDTTQEPGFDEPFHNMLAIGTALDWAIARNRNNAGALAQQWQDYEIRLRRYYGNKQRDRHMMLKPAYEDYN